MYDTFDNNLQTSLITSLHYIDTDSFILCFSEGNNPDEHKDLSSLDISIKFNDKVPGKFKYEFKSRTINEFIVLL